MKLKIEQIGEPKTIITKFGPKEKNWVKVEGEYAGKFLNFWCGESTKSWQVGAVIEVEGVEKRDYTAKDGSLKTSYDIKMPRVGFGEILEQIEGLRKRVFALEEKTKPARLAPPDDYPDSNGPTAFDDEPPF